MRNAAAGPNRFYAKDAFCSLEGFGVDDALALTEQPRFPSFQLRCGPKPGHGDRKRGPSGDADFHVSSHAFRRI